jgi:hypothetical protein
METRGGGASTGTGTIWKCCGSWREGTGHRDVRGQAEGDRTVSSRGEASVSKSKYTSRGSRAVAHIAL